MKYNFIFFSFLFATLFACGGDEVDCTVNAFNAEINATIDAYNNAVVAWNNDNSSENCNKLKDANNDWIDAIEKYLDCEELDQAQIQQGLDAARDALNQFSCN